jgi:hypothetical protein|tara:strand:- start:295 stop:477 length:183 start_codon:yes stop_codon:yes gene_type:complete
MHRVSQKEDDEKYVRELVDLVYSTIEGYEKYLLDEIKHSDLSRIMISLREHTDKHTNHLK